MATSTVSSVFCLNKVISLHNGFFSTNFHQIFSEIARSIEFEFVVIVMKLGKTGNNLSNKNQLWPGQPDIAL